ncbi:threonine ammonia-lyase [Parvularcula sp. IMCC14364]|uniref:threonine ammonia-lyase n=1 Tax=Parvularcula sp. IMCC14364 TaxID=3067902 RepID=UPI002740BDC8|nr:threonine ammonia-lyase [Parvularcula sp. IMCC14364]
MTAKLVNSAEQGALPSLPDVEEDTLAAILNRKDAAWSNVARTPCLKAEKLSLLSGCDLFVKYENMQYTGAFKERGALARLLHLTSQERARGVIAASAGNHAQGLARHASLLGIKATIVMPQHTPYVKVQQTEQLGADVILHGEDFDTADGFAHRKCDEDGSVYVHPFDDPLVMAGQGTVAIEMLEEQPELDVLIVPIGGGGLLSGMAVAARRLKPSIEIIGVQAALYPSMLNAIQGQNAPIGGNTLAEGIAVREPGKITRRVIAEYVDDFLTVDERALERALSLYLTVQKTLSEGAGAVGLAAVLANPGRFQGKRVGTVLCGGNIDTRLLSSILMRDLARQGRVARLRIELLDVPGQLTKVADMIASGGGNVIDVSYHRIFNDLPAKATYLDISVETNDRPHLDRIIENLKASGLPTVIADY